MIIKMHEYLPISFVQKMMVLVHNKRFPDKSLLHPQNSLILKLQGQKGGGVCLRPFLWLKYSNRGQILSSFAYGFRFLKSLLFPAIILGFVNRIKHPSLNPQVLIFFSQNLLFVLNYSKCCLRKKNRSRK